MEALEATTGRRYQEVSEVGDVVEVVLAGLGDVMVEDLAEEERQEEEAVLFSDIPLAEELDEVSLSLFFLL